MTLSTRVLISLFLGVIPIGGVNLDLIVDEVH